MVAAERRSGNPGRPRRLPYVVTERSDAAKASDVASRKGKQVTVDEEEVVRAYLRAVGRNRPQRGRPRDPKLVERRLAEVERQIEQKVDPIEVLELVQRRLELQEELETLRSRTDVIQLTDGFVAVAAAYGERKNISYEAWRELGVPSTILRRAGIRRPRR
jgi:chromosome segregation ATPase